MTLLQSSKSQLPPISEALRIFVLEEDTADARDIHQASSLSDPCCEEHPPLRGILRAPPWF